MISKLAGKITALHAMRSLILTQLQELNSASSRGKNIMDDCFTSAHKPGHTKRGKGSLTFVLSSLMLPAALAFATDQHTLSSQLTDRIIHHSGGQGLAAFQLPGKNNFAALPQDPSNPITEDKVTLGRFLYHETATGTAGTDPERTETWSCASCHHVAAGFKAGIPQGIGEGGVGFGKDGSKRRLQQGLDATAPAGDPKLPDVQPIASPTVLNTAYQDVMLWNGSFGNAPGSVNAHAEKLATAGPEPVKANTFGLSGLETQVLAGTRVHRLAFDNNSILQTNSEYRHLYDKAFPGGYTGFIPDNGTVVSAADLGAAKAIAAYERIIVSNLAPFQRWLSGDTGAMTTQQLRGANLFFGKADCVSCHTGPALSSRAGAAEDEIFFAIGFNDFDPSHPLIHGVIDDATKRGRGAFNGNPADDYKFKIPQLYNLTDTNVFGHGASFTSVKEVIRYKNNAVPQNSAAMANLSEKFRPLHLTESEVNDLTAFIEEGLYDAWLDRYVPYSLPSDQCFPVADMQSAIDLGCLNTDNTHNNGPSDKPVCEFSSSDPDGDGWGWENNQTCIIDDNSTPFVPTNNNNNNKQFCASASSDPDGDGWGWENNQSCVVDNGTTPVEPDKKSDNKHPTCVNANSDPDGDGWGWENNQSCRV